ncbi:glutathione S-transferase [Rhizophagus irregularis]|uniref:glutathione transferase n=1 Tax=Rhizophagus irregularis TaxID=588596 RepID=A0A2N0NTT8_9GLOM|nr:glutathione S-transferase [Rhizophagus irregularis]
MAITVFGRSVSAFNLILFYVLKELGLSYEFVQTTPEEVNSPDYLATKHPFGRTPSLNDDGFQIYETPREELDKNLDVYEKLLEGKDYLTGEFSLADLLHVPLTFYAINSTDEGDLWNKRPNVSRWLKNLNERECWKNVVTEYKLSEYIQYNISILKKK